MAKAKAIKTIAMTATQKLLVAGTLVAAVGSGIYEARQAAIFRSQVSALQHQQTALSDQLTRDRDEAARLLTTLRAENERLNGSTELLRLRGEVGVLRREKAQLSAALTNTALVTGAAAPIKAAALAFGTELRDMGARTPEQAANSLIWAATTGQEARLSELLELPKGVPEEDAANHYKFFANQLSNVFGKMEFLSVQGVKPNQDGTLRINFTYREIPTGKTNPFPFMLRQHESGWKVAVEGNLPPVLRAER